MDLDRIRAACDLVDSHVRLIANRRLARERATDGAAASAVGVVKKGSQIGGILVPAAMIAGLVALGLVLAFVLSRGRTQAPSLRPTSAPAFVRAGSAAPKIDLVSARTVLGDITHAKVITLAAFSLQRNAAIVRTLESASDRGARVSVVLARGFGFYSRQNAETMRDLAMHGVRVHIAGVSQHSTHIKAVVLDGRLYLSDRNWTWRSTDAIVISDSLPGDRVLVERSLSGQSGANDHLWTRKADALWAEANVLAVAHSHVIRVSSESFGGGTAVYARLVQRKKAGDEVRLLIAGSEYVRSQAEQRAVSGLLMLGVQIRLSSSNEKMAIDGTSVWMGSANATAGLRNQLDFGMVVSSNSIATRLREQFDHEWKNAAAVSDSRKIH